jgi:hypothetical protein
LRSTDHSTSFWLDTGYTKFRKPTISQMTGQSSVRFEVRVDNDYEGKALHVLTTDNNMLLQSLDAPSYAPPFVLVSKVADPLKTTYLVKIND